MIKKMMREELVELVQKIVDAVGTEKEIDAWLETLEDNVPHPDVSDLIFYPEKEMTPEEIVNTALSYKPIQL